MEKKSRKKSDMDRKKMISEQFDKKYVRDGYITTYLSAVSKHC